jgi:acetoin utilization deacetylase AcuC-like enzyme
MRKTGLLFDQRYMLHETGPYHPETADRLVAVFRGLKEGDLLGKLLLIKASPAERSWIEMVHDPAYIDSFNDACVAGRKEFQHPDNQMCCDSFDTALLAVGGILDTAAFMMRGEIDNAFCAVRPPGHHAEHAKSLGFCYFNNIAIAARYLQHEWGIQRVGIVDFDVHHGNGTQHIFEDDPTVFYYSIHQHPSFTFPGTGREFEQGSGKGFGFTKNSPVLPGQGDAEYKQLITRDLLPAFDKFAPQVILVSSGFDAHVDDEMADMRVSTEGFAWIMQTIVDLAEDHCGGKLISILEGGYNLKRLPELIAGHVRILLGLG